jgi:Domain of unknown function (DUF4291)
MTHDSTRLIRAAYTDKTIRVYQAYAPEIAEPAIRAGTFVPPFSRERMTWIKPSFGWMMYRSGWVRKSGQERVLAIEIWRDGFEWALGHGLHACAGCYSSSSVSMTTLMLSLARRNEMSSRLLAIENSR